MCYMCHKPHSEVYKVRLVMKGELFKGVIMRVIYLCEGCLTKLREDSATRKWLEVEVCNKVVAPTPTPPTEHPVVEFRTKILPLLTNAWNELVEVGDEMERCERELKRIEGELLEKYGPGYITIKSVKNRVGKRYHYIVYRTVGKDVYIEKELGETYVRLKNELTEIRKKWSELRKLVNELYGWVKATEGYGGYR